MKKSLLFLLSALLHFTIVNGQIAAEKKNNIYLTISSDYENANVYEISALIISNTQNIKMSGEYVSETSVNITPIPDTTIHICPVTASAPKNQHNGGTTVIRTSTGGPGKTYYPEIILYPNPASDFLTVKSPAFPITSYSIYDTSSILHTSKITKSAHEINMDLTNLLPGHYLLILEMEYEKPVSVQFIKK